MTHSTHRRISVRSLTEFIRETEENGRSVDTKMENPEGMLLYTQGVTLPYRQREKRQVFQGKSEAVQELSRQFIECQQNRKGRKYNRKQDKTAEAAAQLDQRQQEMRELQKEGRKEREEMEKGKSEWKARIKARKKHPKQHGQKSKLTRGELSKLMKMYHGRDTHRNSN